MLCLVLVSAALLLPWYADAALIQSCITDISGLCAAGGGLSGGIESSNGTGQWDGGDVSWFQIQKQNQIQANCTNSAGVVDPFCARAYSCGSLGDSLCYVPDGMVNNPAFGDLKGHNQVVGDSFGDYVSVPPAQVPEGGGSSGGGGGGGGGTGGGGGGIPDPNLVAPKNFGGRILMTIPCTANLNPTDKLIVVGPPRGGSFLKTTTTRVYSYRSLLPTKWVLGVARNFYGGCRVGLGPFSFDIGFGRKIKFLGTS